MRGEYGIGMRMQGPTAVMQQGARNESPMHSTTSRGGGCRDRWRPSIGTTNQPITTIIMNEARGENDSDQNWEQKTCSSTKHLQRKIQRNNYRKYHHTHRTNQVAEESMHSQLRQTMAALSSVVSSNYAGRAELYTTKRIFYGEVVSPLAMDTVWGPSKAGKVTPDLSPGMSSQ